ncbi:MAG: DUF2179 domain-containing protein [Candidatus Omnitrophota bacterium]
MESFTQTTVFHWAVLPLFIMIARILDVSLDTLRIMLFSRGKKIIPPLLGFIQVMIWLLAIRQIFLNLSNWLCFFAYAGGFAIGTFAGMMIEEKLAIGIQVVRIITRVDSVDLVQFLMRRGYGVTSVEGQGATGKVNIIYTIVNRTDVPRVLKAVQRFNPKAFYTIEDVRTAKEGILAAQKTPAIARF